MIVGLITAVLLLGACLGLLVSVLVALARGFARLELLHMEVNGLLRDAVDTTREVSAERGKHLDAAGEVLLAETRAIAGALRSEIRHGTGTESEATETEEDGHDEDRS